MSRIKTERERAEKGLIKGQKMAEAFAKHSAKPMLRAFLTESGFNEESYKAYLATKDNCTQTLTLTDYTDFLVEDFERPFGEVLALSYALGYIDAIQGKSIKELYVPRSLAAMPGEPEAKAEGQTELTSKLFLPGEG